MLVWTRLRIVGIIAQVAVCAMPTGCNDKQKISNASMLVRASAVSSKGTAADLESRARQIIGACALQPPDVKFIEEQATAIADGAVFIGKEQAKVIAASQTIDNALPHVENKSGFWDSVWFYVKWTVIIGGGLVAWTFLERAGILPIIKKLFSLVPGLIDVFMPHVSREANAAAQVLDPQNPMKPEEAVAARRAADPVFNAAFKRQKRKIEAEKGEAFVQQSQEVVTQ